jgi:hypothetical protein
MVTRLVKLAVDLSAKYKADGLSVLLNCKSQPEFLSLMEHVKTLSPDVFGIQQNNLNNYFTHSSISYFNIIDDKDISIGIFCLAKGA